MNGYTINWCGIHDCLPDWKWTTDDGGFSDFDLWCVFRGRGEIFVAEDHFDVSPGSCLLLPPNTKIAARHDKSDPLLVINAHFSPDNAEEFSQTIKPYHRKIRNKAFFRELLDRMLFSYFRKETQKAEMWLSAALSELFSAEGELQSAAKSRGRSVVYEICNEIVGSSAYNVKLSVFAKKYGYSPAYLGKLFHAAVGMEFEKYLINARIGEAKMLLRSSDFSVARISEMLGYCDTCFFIKQFTKYVGVTPGKYR